MRIIELKSQNIKIIYKPLLYQLRVGDFVSLKEGELTLVAQVYKLATYEQASEYNLAELTLVLTNKYGNVKKWNGEIVSLEAEIEITPIDFIENYINDDNENIFSIGYYNGNLDMPVRCSINHFQTPAIIAYDKPVDNITLVKNIATQFVRLGKKFLIIDYTGNMEIKGAKRVLAGFQDKLILNAEILENLSDKITEGISIESKAVIDDILIDLANYAKETAAGFIPIENLINVISDIYKKNKIPQLLLLRNKLRKYQKTNIFADKIAEYDVLSTALNQNLPVIFDLSNVPFEWQQEYYSKALNLIKEKNEDFYFNVIADEKTFDNNLLKYLLFKAQKDGIKSILSINYKHTSFNTVLDFCKNIFFLKTHNGLKHKPYLSEIIQSLPQSYFIAKGTLTSDLFIAAYMDNLNNNMLEEYDKLLKTNDTANETLDIIQNNIDIGSLSNPKPPVTNVDMNVLNTALEPEQTNLFTPVVQLNEIKNINQEMVVVNDELSENNIQEAENIVNQEIENNIQEVNLVQQDTIIEEKIQNPQENLQAEEEQTQEQEENSPADVLSDISENIVVEDEINLQNEEVQIDIIEDNSDNIQEVLPDENNNIISDITDNVIDNDILEADNLAENEMLNIQENANVELEVEQTDVAQDLSEISNDNVEFVQEDVQLQENLSSQEEIEPEFVESNTSDSEEINLEDIDFDDNTFNELENTSVEEIGTNTLEDIPADSLDFIDEMQDEIPQETINTEQNSIENDEELLDLLNDVDEDSFEDILSAESEENVQFDDVIEERGQNSVDSAPQKEKIPVYSANYADEESTEDFQCDFKEGDLVKHNKYGLGTIAKVTAHANKVLCHINFENFGRRLLDPAISQLEKIE